MKKKISQFEQNCFEELNRLAFVNLADHTKQFIFEAIQDKHKALTDEINEKQIRYKKGFLSWAFPLLQRIDNAFLLFGHLLNKDL